MAREGLDLIKKELKEERQQAVGHAVPELEPGVRRENDRMPVISKMQIDLMVNSFAADFARVATFQITNSVGQARMRWLGITEGHHELTHHFNDPKKMAKVRDINQYHIEQFDLQGK